MLKKFITSEHLRTIYCSQFQIQSMPILMSLFHKFARYISVVKNKKML